MNLQVAVGFRWNQFGRGGLLWSVVFRWSPRELLVFWWGLLLVLRWSPPGFAGGRGRPDRSDCRGGPGCRPGRGCLGRRVVVLSPFCGDFTRASWILDFTLVFSWLYTDVGQQVSKAMFQWVLLI